MLINVTYQCSSVMPISPPQCCLSVAPIGAHQCRLMVLVNAAYQCLLSRTLGCVWGTLSAHSLLAVVECQCPVVSATFASLVVPPLLFTKDHFCSTDHQWNRPRHHKPPMEQAEKGTLSLTTIVMKERKLQLSVNVMGRCKSPITNNVTGRGQVTTNNVRRALQFLLIYFLTILISLRFCI